MCLLVLAWHVAPRRRLVLAGNRDEFHARPAAPMDWWPEPPLLAGRDLQAGGTWLGVDAAGRFAVVTNFREPTSRPAAPAAPAGRAPSRGELIPRFLAGRAGPLEYARTLRAAGEAYAGFSLLLGDASELVYVSNRDAAGPRRLGPGVYGLGNGLLDSPWPKVERTRERLRGLIEQSELEPERLFALMSDRTPAADHELPDTGLGRALERALSPAFVVGAEYGTRCTTVLALDAQGGSVAERGFDPAGRVLHTRRFELPESAA